MMNTGHVFAIEIHNVNNIVVLPTIVVGVATVSDIVVTIVFSIDRQFVRHCLILGLTNSISIIMFGFSLFFLGIGTRVNLQSKF